MRVIENEGPAGCGRVLPLRARRDLGLRPNNASSVQRVRCERGGGRSTWPPLHLPTAHTPSCGMTAVVVQRDNAITMLICYTRVTTAQAGKAGRAMRESWACGAPAAWLASGRTHTPITGHGNLGTGQTGGGGGEGSTSTSRWRTRCGRCTCPSRPRLLIRQGNPYRPAATNVAGLILPTADHTDRRLSHPTPPFNAAASYSLRSLPSPPIAPPLRGDHGLSENSSIFGFALILAHTLPAHSATDAAFACSATTCSPQNIYSCSAVHTSQQTRQRPCHSPSAQPCHLHHTSEPLRDTLETCSLLIALASLLPI